MLPSSGLPSISNPLQQNHYQPLPPTQQDDVSDLASVTCIQDLDRLSISQLSYLMDEGVDEVMDACHHNQLQPLLSSLQTFQIHLFSLAQENLVMKIELESQQKLLLLKKQEWKDVRQRWSHNIQTFNKQCHQTHNTLSLLDNMRVAVMEADQTSDNTAHSFVNQESSLDIFLKTFISQRTLYHKRRCKEDKMFLLCNNN